LLPPLRRAAAKQANLKLKVALNTHCHADHITGTGELKKRLPGLESAISAVAGAKADLLFNEGDEYTFGIHSLQMLSTPGHTSGCSSFYVPAAELVMTGDALFVGGCGRTDFQGVRPHMYVYMYICIHTHTHIYIYINSSCPRRSS